MKLFGYIARRLWNRQQEHRVISAPVVKIATASVAVGMAVMILTLSIVTGFKNEIKKRAIGFAGHIVITAYTSNNSYEQEPIPGDAAFLATLRAHPGVAHVQPFATKNAIIKTAFENQGIILKGVDKTYRWDFISQYMLDGGIPVYGDSASVNLILISQTIATKLGVKTGDKLLTYFVGRKRGESGDAGYEQRTRRFIVSGIYQTGFAEIDNNVVYADLRQIQRLNYWDKRQTGGFEVEIADFAQLDEMTEWVNDEVGQGLEARSVDALYPTLFSWLQLLDSNAAIIIALMIAVAVINMISALLILILERSNTIGILKALGSTNALVQRVFLFQAWRILGKGLLIGNLLGLALAFTQKTFKVVSLNPDTYYVSFVPVELPPAGLLGLNAATVVCCLLMMLLPVLVISKITPAKTLRFK